MRYSETTLQMVQRHVRDGETILARQRRLIERMTDAGQPTEEAERLLASFIWIQLSTSRTC